MLGISITTFLEKAYGSWLGDHRLLTPAAWEAEAGGCKFKASLMSWLPSIDVINLMSKNNLERRKGLISLYGL